MASCKHIKLPGLFNNGLGTLLHHLSQPNSLVHQTLREGQLIRELLQPKQPRNTFSNHLQRCTHQFQNVSSLFSTTTELKKKSWFNTNAACRQDTDSIWNWWNGTGNAVACLECTMGCGKFIFMHRELAAEFTPRGSRRRGKLARRRRMRTLPAAAARTTSPLNRKDKSKHSSEPRLAGQINPP